MPINIIDVDEFTDPITAPAGADPANAASVVDPIQKLANRTRHIKNRLDLLDVQVDNGEWIYPTPKSRTVVIPVTAWQTGLDTDGSFNQPATWDFFPRLDYAIASKGTVTHRGCAAVALNRYLPHGALITFVEVLVRPGASRSSGSRMKVGLTAHVNKNYATGLADEGTVIDVISAEDDGTANLQGIQLTPSTNRTIFSTVPYILWVWTGTGDTDPDRLYGASVHFADPGPRNI